MTSSEQRVPLAEVVTPRQFSTLAVPWSALSLASDLCLAMHRYRYDWVIWGEEGNNGRCVDRRGCQTTTEMNFNFEILPSNVCVKNGNAKLCSLTPHPFPTPAPAPALLGTHTEHLALLLFPLALWD